MKRRKMYSSETSECKDRVDLPVVVEASSPEANPDAVAMDECEVPVSSVPLESSSSLPNVAELHLQEIEDRSQFYSLPDELLLKAFEYIHRPVDCWEAAKVCKRWCVLQSLLLLKRRSIHKPGNYPCFGSKKGKRLGSGLGCKGTGKSLELAKAESDWRLSMDLIKCCRRHTYALQIKDCTHISERGYQLIAGFASNLKVLRLESCISMDDPSFDVMLDRSESLLSLHLSNVPKLTLKNIENMVPRLRNLYVHGCTKVAPNTVLSVLRGRPNLRFLSLSAMGVSNDPDEIKIAEGPPLLLQTLELLNTEGVTDVFLQAFAGRLSNLRNLNLSKCPSLSDDGIMAVFASCRNCLQRLVVRSCPSISDGTASALAAGATNLQNITLAGTRVSDDGLKALMGSEAVVSKLKNLSVAGCQRVTDAGLQHLVSKQKNLVLFKSLDVQSCPEVTVSAVKALRGSLRSSTKKIPWKIVYDGKSEGF